MVAKRVFASAGEPQTKVQKVGTVNEYDGFYPGPDSKVETIKLSEINPDQFYNDYVKSRTPVIIDGITPGLDISKFQPDVIVDTLGYEEPLLVEKKHKGGFGSGTQRIKMKFNELMKKMKEGDDYYLTTQYAENEPDSDEDEEVNSKDDGSSSSDSDEEDEAEDGTNGFEIPKGSDFSDTDSIDMNDIHDDFDDISGSDNEELDPDVLVSKKFPHNPLYKSEAVRRVKELLQRPLTNLLKTSELPLCPSILENLVTQQINLWMGSSSATTKSASPKIDPNASDLGLGRQIFGGGVSSGLHHDHSDNLYVPIKGSKRFTIFAPNDGVNLYTVGDINKIFKSGVIDYKTNDNAPMWREVRDDGAIVTEVYKSMLDNYPKSVSKADRSWYTRCIEDEESVLDEHVFMDQSKGLDPPSFSKIPAAIVHLDKIKDVELREKLTKLAQTKWPNFFKCSRLTIDLKPGQMFYLPAGWFHEVTSFGDSKSDNIHIALNYWYSPPNGDQKTYKDKYWLEDFKRTKESCDLFKQDVFKL